MAATVTIYRLCVDGDMENRIGNFFCCSNSNFLATTPATVYRLFAENV